mmetsp:Transcript_49468/g.102061  ORF Transcript_49468/g.102061 Transcript_49468/m.102061 type:complete len:264 (+) Transcript_49468:78-869(+)
MATSGLCLAFAFMSIVSALQMMPEHLPIHMPFYKDPIKQREHIIVTGPEGSGSTFVKDLLKDVFHIPQLLDMLDDLGVPNNDDAIVFHISQPDGADWPGRDPEMLESFSKPSIRLINDHAPLLFFLNLTSTIMEYRSNGESVHIVQLVRDPRASLASKLDKAAQWKSRDQVEEQHTAFKLMLEVKDMPETTTICYEQMLQDNGDAYLSERLSKFGVSREAVPKIINANAKYVLNATQACDQDDLAYMQLCPQSPLTAQLKDHC